MSKGDSPSTEEEAKGSESSPAWKLSSNIKNVKNTEEEKSGSSRKAPTKTVVVCAINDSELNKVEYAYFKRPLPLNQASVILSDK